MTRCERIRRLAISGVSLLALAAHASADWPTYRGDYGRTGVCRTRLPDRLTPLWSHQARQPPQHAWPDPARGSYWQQLRSIAPRVIDDHAFHPVIARGLVLYGSSADDSVRALELDTGKVVWRHTVGGPVRYAPAVDGGRVVFGADDGRVHCVDLKTGRPNWSTHIAPCERYVPGNGRLISAWPVRTSTAIADGVGYAFAGLFPSQGVHLARVDVTTGEVISRNRVEMSPQGYLLLDEDRLYAPTGRAAPWVLDRRTGETLGQLPGEGGAFAVVSDERFYAGGGNEGALIASETATRKRLARFAGRQIATTKDVSYLVGPRSTVALARDAESPLWKAATPAAESIAVCENRVLVGADSQVSVLDRASGEVVQRLEVRGRVLSLAISDGALVVATDVGGLHAFGAGHHFADLPDEQNHADPRPLQSTLTGAEALLAGVRRGYVVTDTADTDLIDALVAETDYRVVVIGAADGSVVSLRDHYLERGAYGTRVACVRRDSLPHCASGFANVVIGSADLARLAKPGGWLWSSPSEPPSAVPPPRGTGSWTHLYGSTANTCDSGDRVVTDDLILQWFGGPGPKRMTDRHLRAPAPLARDGLLIIPGEDRFIAVDSRNGVELWEREVPGSQRYSTPYDCGYYGLDGRVLAVAARSEAVLIDTADGRVIDKTALPARTSDAAARYWGYLAIDGGRLLGTAMKATAARLEPSREQIDIDYRNKQPLVTGSEFFSMDRQDGSVAWRRAGCVLHPTICMDDESVWFVESQSASATDHPTGRIHLDEFLGSDARLVRLDKATGEPVWSRPLPPNLLACTNILYVQARDGGVLVSGSLTEENDTVYRFAWLDAATGVTRWTAQHAEGKPGAFTHGEQVHHPLLLHDRVIAEPAIYRLADGVRIDPGGAESAWRMVRPGHSCGTLSGCQAGAFFRATNPAFMSFGGSRPAGSIEKLAPSRPGCWINILPADGLVLIPEASASCVCSFSLQTSMAFAPADR